MSSNRSYPTDEDLDRLQHYNEMATNWEGQISVEDTNRLIQEIRRVRSELRDICGRMNGFRYQTYTDILVDVRVALTGRPRAEIDAEHTIELSPEASAQFVEIMNRPVGDYVGRMRQKAIDAAKDGG